MEPDNGSVERLVVTLKLREGTHERAAELVAEGPPFDPADLGLARHAVYLGDDLVIFTFEGEGVEQRVRSVSNDPVRSTSFAAWMPLLDNRPALAHEVYYWEVGGLIWRHAHETEELDSGISSAEAGPVAA